MTTDLRDKTISYLLEQVDSGLLEYSSPAAKEIARRLAESEHIRCPCGNPADSKESRALCSVGTCYGCLSDRLAEAEQKIKAYERAECCPDEQDCKHLKQVAERDAVFISEMVDRFLGWRLPRDFYPDGGITFQPIGNGDYGPTGTNLFTAVQAEQMFKHCLPATAKAKADVLMAANKLVDRHFGYTSDFSELEEAVRAAKEIE